MMGQVAGKATPLIFDTDMGPDYDDVGAIALLHAFADSGRIRILGTMASDRYEGVAAVKAGAGYHLFLISDSLKEDGKPKLLVYDWQP